jgi:hypothetical protein
VKGRDFRALVVAAAAAHDDPWMMMSASIAGMQ